MSIAGLDPVSVDDMPDDYGRWLIHGPQGSGKTTLASTIAKLGKTLFIDTTGEKGIRSIKGLPWGKNVEIVRPTSVTSLDDVFWELNAGKHDYKAVVIDSLTGVQKMTMRFLLGHSETAVREIKQGTAPADIRTWGQSLDVMIDIATFWYGLADAGRPKPMHVVMTAQTKVVDDEIAQTSMRTPDVQKGALSIVLASPDYICYTQEEENTEDLREDGTIGTRHVMLFGGHPGYRTKARIPYALRGKLPSVIGRGKNTPDLAALSRVLKIGGAAADHKSEEESK